MLKIEALSVAELIPYARNSRTHSDGQIAELAGSIKEFGFCNPVLVDEGGGIIAGHGRVKAAMLLKMEHVPCIRLEHLTPTQRRAYVIADNRLALNAGWDQDMLKLELMDLSAEDFKIELLGFDKDELADLLAPAGTEGNTDPDDIPENVETRCNPGQLWKLGNHRLLCGDSTKREDVERLMGGEKADMVFTDPPYGISERTDRKSSGRGKICAGKDFAPVIGDESTSTAIEAYHLCESLGVQLIVIWGANYFCECLPPKPSWIVWDKRDGKGRDDNADCELAWTNRGGPSRVFTHLWKGAIKASEHGERRVHPTQKPVALAEWSISEYPRSRVITVLDLFLGSGSTLIACEKTGRRCFGMEIDPHYCSVVIERWQNFTGQVAVLDG